MLSKTGKLRSGYEEITPPHLALMKVEIQAKGCFFLCSLDFFASFLFTKYLLVLVFMICFAIHQWKKEEREPEVANFGEHYLKQHHSKPPRHCVPPLKRGI